jgi:hypothetical protein
MKRICNFGGWAFTNLGLAMLACSLLLGPQSNAAISALIPRCSGMNSCNTGGCKLTGSYCPNTGCMNTGSGPCFMCQCLPTGTNPNGTHTGCGCG